MTPKITVLLAVHNGEPYVRQCVASVLQQTFGDFELLIVDDASTDRTVETIESFGDTRIRVLRNESNIGQVPSLNRGLREARGEYIARIDHDDWCRPTRLERQVAVLDATPDVGLVGTWMDIVADNDHRVARLRSTIADYAEFVYHTLIMRVYISHPSAMYRREPVLALGCYDESTAPAEDKDLWRKLALERWDARIVPEALVVYRLHEGQLSQVHAAHQAHVDSVSQERFLAALAPGAPVQPLRMLLAADPAFWAGPHDVEATLAALQHVLAGARERLRLGDGEGRKVEQLVAQQLLDVARMKPWRPTAQALRAYGLSRIAPERRRRATVAGLAALAWAPPHDAGRWLARRIADRVDGIPGVRALKRPAKRSRFARLLYGKLVGGD